MATFNQRIAGPTDDGHAALIPTLRAEFAMEIEAQKIAPYGFNQVGAIVADPRRSGYKWRGARNIIFEKMEPMEIQVQIGMIAPMTFPVVDDLERIEKLDFCEQVAERISEWANCECPELAGKYTPVSFDLREDQQQNAATRWWWVMLWEFTARGRFNTAHSSVDKTT